MTTAFPRYSRRLDALTVALEERDRVRRERLLEEFRARRDAGELDDPERVAERDRVESEQAARPSLVDTRSPQELHRHGLHTQEEFDAILAEPGGLDWLLLRYRHDVLRDWIDQEDGPERDRALLLVLDVDDLERTRWR